MKLSVLGILLCSILCWGFQTSAQEKYFNADELYRLAKIEANQNQNYGKAANLCKQALALTPEYFDIRVLLGKCFLELKNYDSARYELKKVLEKYPNNVDAKHYLINVEYSTNRYSSAICLVNELLEIRPYSKTLWMKKISLYNDMGNKLEARKAITRLYNIYPNDSFVARSYRNFMQEEAEQYYKRGNFNKSKELLEKVIENNARDLPAIQKLVNTYLSAGKKLDALAAINLGLATYPTDAILIEKKIGILTEQGNYADAIQFTESVLKKYPSPKLRSTLNELKLESARYYNNADPYVLYQKVYDANPGNQEAFNYLLSNSLSKGYYSDAEEYIRIALKRNPNDKNALAKQLTLLEAQGKTEEAKKAIERMAQKFPTDGDIQEKYSSVLFAQAKGYFQDQQYRQAEEAFDKLTRFADYRTVATEYLYSIKLAEKNYPEAMNRINRLIATNPRNDDYVFKKSALLEEMGQYDEALKITKNLSERNPTNTRFRDIYSSQSTPYIKQLIENEKYDSAIVVINNLLDNDPTNSLAYHYAINVNSQIKNYTDGILFCNKAMQYYPESRDFRLKKADMFTSMKSYDSATAVLEELHDMFPYNDKITATLAESYFMQGKRYENDFYIDSAMYYYAKTQAVSPKDSYSLYRLVNLSLENKAFDSAVTYLDKGLENFPENTQLLYKKGLLYEMLEKYDSAYLYVKKAEPPFSSPVYQNYLNYLQSKSFHNQAGVLYTRAFFDSSILRSSIATFEYTRFQPRNTYIYRFNYAARPVGTGVQNEFEWFHKVDKKLYSQFNFAFANKFAFPRIRTSISIFNSLPYDWEYEVGLRYVLQQSGTNVLSLVGGLSKSWEEVWLNARAFVLTDFNKFYNTLLFQSRYYFNYKNDYLTIMGSIGTPPEDKTLDFALTSFLNYSTRMVGAGIQHKVKHRSTIGILGNWYNYQIQKDYFYNQYNVQITLLTKF